MMVKTIARVPLTCLALALVSFSSGKSQQAAKQKDQELTGCMKNMPARFAAKPVSIYGLSPGPSTATRQGHFPDNDNGHTGFCCVASE